MKLNKLILILSIFIIISCGKNHEPEKNIDLDFEYTVQDDRVILDASDSFPDQSEEIEYYWESTDPEIYINQNDKNSAFFIFPDRATESEISIRLIINENDEFVHKNIKIPAFNDHISKWGLGEQSRNRKSNEREYNWYFDQLNTGKYNYENCGPTCATMAIKWAHRDWDKDAEYARSQYYPNGGWWYTSNIIDYLNSNNVHTQTIHLKSKSDLYQHLNNGQIAIICLDMHLLRLESTPEHHIDKYYRTNPEAGHFLIVKGYRQTDESDFLEIYDPNSWGATYDDNTLKGINRYYRVPDIMRSTNSWWKYAIIVSKKAIKTKSELDPNSIEHAWGK